MIKALVDLAERNREKGDEKHSDALKKEPFSIILEIKKDGSFSRFYPTEKMFSPAEALSSKKGKARLLLDKSAEVFRYYKDEKGKTDDEKRKKATKKHQLFIEKLNQYSKLKVLKPVFSFYGENKKNGVEKALTEFEVQVNEKERGGNIAFLIQGADKRVHEEPEIVEQLEQFFFEKQLENVGKTKKRCSICGGTHYPVMANPHGMVKRVPSGKESGCALVSYNEDAYLSYDLKGNENSYICSHCATAYTESLNWLMTNSITIEKEIKGKSKRIPKFTNRKNLGDDTAIVFWTKKECDLKELYLMDENSQTREDDIYAFVHSDQAEIKNYNKSDEHIGNLISSAGSGNSNIAHNIDNNVFYSLTLSGAAARIAIRDWIEMSLNEFKINISKWFKDISLLGWEAFSKEKKIIHPTLYNLSATCEKKKDKNKTMLSRVEAALWKSALKGYPIPSWILVHTIKRAQVESTKQEENHLSQTRASLIKLILKRNYINKGEYNMEELDEKYENPAYICGRLFSILENLQYQALGEVNAGIRERLFTSASTTPSTAFARLFKTANHHLVKLKSEKPGVSVNIDKKIQELCSKLEEFPPWLSLEEQGKFMLGYYHQKNQNFSKKGEANEQSN